MAQKDFQTTQYTSPSRIQQRVNEWVNSTKDIPKEHKTDLLKKYEALQSKYFLGKPHITAEQVNSFGFELSVAAVKEDLVDGLNSDKKANEILRSHSPLRVLANFVQALAQQPELYEASPDLSRGLASLQQTDAASPDTGSYIPSGMEITLPEPKIPPRQVRRTPDAPYLPLTRPVNRPIPNAAGNRDVLPAPSSRPLGLTSVSDPLPGRVVASSLPPKEGSSTPQSSPVTRQNPAFPPRAKKRSNAVSLEETTGAWRELVALLNPNGLVSVLGVRWLNEAGIRIVASWTEGSRSVIFSRLRATILESQPESQEEACRLLKLISKGMGAHAEHFKERDEGAEVPVAVQESQVTVTPSEPAAKAAAASTAALTDTSPTPLADNQFYGTQQRVADRGEASERDEPDVFEAGDKRHWPAMPSKWVERLVTSNPASTRALRDIHEEFMQRSNLIKHAAQRQGFGWQTLAGFTDPRSQLIAKTVTPEMFAEKMQQAASKLPDQMDQFDALVRLFAEYREAQQAQGRSAA